MKVSAGEHVAFSVHRFWILHEHQRVVDGGVCLRLEYQAAVLPRVAHRAVNLRDTAQGIGILHAATVAMRVPDFALFEQAAKIGGSFDLPSVGARLLNALVESDVGSLEGIA